MTAEMLKLFGFQSRRHICSGLPVSVPAAVLTGQHTCKTTATVFRAAYRCLHSQFQGLTAVQSLIVQPVRHVRKLYPNPIEEDPEFRMPPKEDTVLDVHHIPELSNLGPELTERVVNCVKSGNMGRLFAVVHIDGQQRKVTSEDLLLVNGFFPPQIGDKIRLEKVMLVGGKDFTLFGRPLLSRDLVKVEATVIEKTLSHIRVDYTQKKRFRRLKLLQHPQSVLVINSIQLDPSQLSS